MKDRLAKARRLLAVQTDLDRLAAWRLIDLDRRSAALDDRRQALINFLDRSSAFSPFFAGAAMRGLETLQRAAAELSCEQAAQADRRRGERVRLRQAGVIVEKLETEEERRLERLRLADTIEASLNWRPQGPGKSDGPV